MEESDAEVVVIVEALDGATGASVQARQSYKSSDVIWTQSRFSPCMFRDSRQGDLVIDFDRFHQTTLVSDPNQLCDIETHS